MRDPPIDKAEAVKYPAANALARLEREYLIGITLNLPGVRRVIGLSEWMDRPALDLEYIPGVTFKTYFKDPEHRHITTV